jgi:hypothetical protein
MAGLRALCHGHKRPQESTCAEALGHRFGKRAPAPGKGGRPKPGAGRSIPEPKKMKLPARDRVISVESSQDEANPAEPSERPGTDRTP